jgi:hypothetical protein
VSASPIESKAGGCRGRKRTGALGSAPESSGCATVGFLSRHAGRQPILDARRAAFAGTATGIRQLRWILHHVLTDVQQILVAEWCSIRFRYKSSRNRVNTVHRAFARSTDPIACFKSLGQRVPNSGYDALCFRLMKVPFWQLRGGRNGHHDRRHSSSVHGSGHRVTILSKFAFKLWFVAT